MGFQLGMRVTYVIILTYMKDYSGGYVAGGLEG